MSEETTIQCDCPQCGRVCGFKACYAGRIARCLNCSTRFTIPVATGQPARALQELPAAALPGFYRNALVGSLKAFVHPESRVGLVFCTALVVFHFLLGNVDLSFTLFAFRPPLVLGWIVTFVTFGCFAWYCMEIITAAHMGANGFPPVETESGFEFIWLVIKNCYLFLVSFIIALLPASFISAWFDYFDLPLGAIYYGLAAACLLLWPLNLAILALETPWWRLFRYDLLITTIRKSFKPYLLTTLLTLTAFYGVFSGMASFATDSDRTLMAAFGLLALRLVGVGVFVFAMRVIGVYCRHYQDVCPQLWTTEPPERPGGD